MATIHGIVITAPLDTIRNLALLKANDQQREVITALAEQGSRYFLGAWCVQRGLVSIDEVGTYREFTIGEKVTA